MENNFVQETDNKHEITIYVTTFQEKQNWAWEGHVTGDQGQIMFICNYWSNIL